MAASVGSSKGVAASTPPSSRPVNAPTWVKGVLDGIQAPVNRTNVDALILWSQAEGMSSSSHNWLATTQRSPYGGSSINAVGVQAYPDEGTGIQATVDTLNQKPYTAVVAAMRKGADLGTIWAAINGSPWCGGCQNGFYPNTFGIRTRLAVGDARAQAALSGTGTYAGGQNATKGVGGCGAKGAAFKVPIPLVNFSLSWCQLKALSGGLIMVSGAALMIFGVAAIVAAGLGGGPAAQVVQAGSKVAGIPQQRRERTERREGTLARTETARSQQATARAEGSQAEARAKTRTTRERAQTRQQTAKARQAEAGARANQGARKQGSRAPGTRARGYDRAQESGRANARAAGPFPE